MTNLSWTFNMHFDHVRGTTESWLVAFDGNRYFIIDPENPKNELEKACLLDFKANCK